MLESEYKKQDGYHSTSAVSWKSDITQYCLARRVRVVAYLVLVAGSTPLAVTSSLAFQTTQLVVLNSFSTVPTLKF